MSKVTEVINHTPVAIKAVADVGAAGVAWTAFFTSIMPNVVVVLSAVWIILQIYTWFINKKWIKGN